jgi:UDP-glucuronate 4-epimerase
MLRGESLPIYGDGTALRDFTHIDDVIDGVVRALDTDLGFALLNLGAGRQVSVLDVVKLLEKALEVSAELQWLPRQLGDVTQTWADISAAQSALGYEPRVAIETGIERFVEWLREES